MTTPSASTRFTWPPASVTTKSSANGTSRRYRCRMGVPASRASRKGLDVRLPGLAFRPDEIRQDLNGLVAHDAKLHDHPRVHRGALADAQLRILAIVGLELHLSLEDLEGLRAPVRVRRGAPVRVHRDVAGRVE